MAAVAAETRKALLALAGLTLLAYLPLFAQPLLEDDYHNIVLARGWALAGWMPLAQEPAFRLRATSYLLTYTIDALFGVRAPAFACASILVHVLNTWLVYRLGQRAGIGPRVAFWAAAFFAVAEGHQEAVMWFSAVNESLEVLFGLCALNAWTEFERRDRRGWAWYAGAVLAFALALISKESAVIWVALFALLTRPRSWRALLPFAALAMAAAVSVRAGSESFRFSDGSFSLDAPFGRTLAESFARMLWPWGAIAFVAVLIWRPAGWRWLTWRSLAWIALALLPFSFLTYQTRVPSRHTYLASVGLTLLVGAALAELQVRARPVVFALALTTLISVNVGILWTKKRQQFLARAAPTEQLVTLARATPGPIYVRCFPRPRVVAESAVVLRTAHPASDLLWTEEDATRATAIFCYQP